MALPIEVEKAVGVLKRFAGEGEPLKEESWSWDDDLRPGERPNVNEVRSICRALLVAANADDLGGCMLCGG
jgi:hypothetical protein